MSSEQKEDVISSIKGMRDILPDEARLWQAVESSARQTFELYGFRELRAPILEPTELFERGTGTSSDIVTKEMYTFTDKGGRSVTLRPEYTPSVVRAIIEHRLDLKPQPLRFYYTGPMFRYDRPQKGRYRQFHQIDVEVFGEPDAAIDAEIIEMAYRFFQEVKVEGVSTLVNSVGCPKCRPVYGLALREAAAKVKSQLCPDCQRKAEINPLRIFDCKQESCREAATTFPRITDYLCEECQQHFKNFLSYLELYHLPYKVEPTLVRGLDYYTRTTFELVVENLGAQNAIGGGGRYDNMVKEFGGPDLCGTGLAIGLERLLLVSRLEAPPPSFAYFAYSGEQARQASLLAARYFRSLGIPCIIEFKERSWKAHFSRANKIGATWTVIIGEDEMSSGEYQLKDMLESKQYKGTIEQLAQIVLGKKQARQGVLKRD
ncbi:MAG TPA: histidine--tRNA ligase [Candidatus Saccharicenans sp.]|nr:histidine--tRNA ligase [Candidatus Saccharicenans sp.]HQO75187.1 histidine--tRNA ligase [Candidatus Saccharicenans sp.]HUM78378.1 histidine--tRNA ligase [Candidatus Saccharicenans sp.]